MLPSTLNAVSAIAASSVSLLFRAPSTQIGNVELDAAISEAHANRAEVTQFPVEKGADITDHIRRTPDELRIEGVITNTPLVLGAAFRGSSTRAEEAHEQLQSLIGQVVDVVTSLRHYKNMAITSIDVPRDKDLSNALQVSVSLRQIVTVESQSVEAPKVEQPPPPKQLGKKHAVPAPPAVTKSAAAQMADWTKGWLFGGRK